MLCSKEFDVLYNLVSFYIVIFILFSLRGLKWCLPRVLWFCITLGPFSNTIHITNYIIIESSSTNKVLMFVIA